MDPLVKKVLDFTRRPPMGVRGTTITEYPTEEEGERIVAVETRMNQPWLYVVLGVLLAWVVIQQFLIAGMNQRIDDAAKLREAYEVINARKFAELQVFHREERTDGRRGLQTVAGRGGLGDVGETDPD